MSFGGVMVMLLSIEVASLCVENGSQQPDEGWWDRSEVASVLLCGEEEFIPFLHPRMRFPCNPLWISAANTVVAL